MHIIEKFSLHGIYFEFANFHTSRKYVALQYTVYRAFYHTCGLMDHIYMEMLHLNTWLCQSTRTIILFWLMGFYKCCVGHAVIINNPIISDFLISTNSHSTQVLQNHPPVYLGHTVFKLCLKLSKWYPGEVKVIY